jgi:hypothetical protein
MSYVYFDIETEWLRHSDPLPVFVIAGFCVDDGPVQFRFSKATARNVILDAIARGDTVVCHRGAFELGTLEIPRGVKLYDTALVATIEGAARGDPDAAGHSLKSLGKKAGYEYAAGSSKGEKGMQGSWRAGDQFTEAQLQYLRDDVQCTRAVHRWQMEKYSPDRAVLARELEWSRDVFEMGRRGLHIDQERVEALMAENMKEQSQMWRALRDCGIIQPRGPKKDPWRKSSVDEATVQGLLKAAGVTEVTEGSEDAEEEDQLLVADRLTLVKSGDPRLKLLADYKTKGKHYGLIKAYKVDGGVVRARYNSLVATGRMSCSAPNVQQVPKRGGLRECWRPSSADSVLVEGDYSMLELYTFADTCARWGIPSRLREALNAGQDVHTIVAQNPAVGSRDLAKVFNYGGLGGMGPETMQENVEKQLHILLPVEQIALAQAAWRETWPEVPEYWKYNTRIAHPAGFKRNKWGVMKMTYKYKVTNPQSGRQRLAFYCAAQNFGFQGPGGDIIKLLQNKAHKRGLHPVAALHDQLMCDELAKDALEAKVTLRECMREAAEEICPNVRWPDQEIHIFTERWKSK